MSQSRLETLQAMARGNPGDPRLQFGLAVEYMNAGRLQEGVEALRSYLDQAEDEGNGWGRLGAALAELGKREEAREAYRRGIEVASKRGHDGLTEELEEALEDLA